MIVVHGSAGWSIKRSWSSIDDCSKANLDKLVDIVNELLGKKVSQVDLETGQNVEVPDEGTNAEQLAKFAKQLSHERRRRHNELATTQT